MRVCDNCGREAAPNDVYCRSCGNRLFAEPGLGDEPTGVMGPAGGARGANTPYPYAQQLRDSNLAVVLEILPGIFGLLGIGHIYGGYTNRGIVLLVVWLLFVAAETSTGVICCTFPLHLIVPVISGIWVKREMDGQPLPFGR